MTDDKPFQRNRRVSTRLVIPPDVIASAKLQSRDSAGDTLAGAVTDISTGGVNVKLRQAPLQPWRNEERFSVVLDLLGAKTVLPATVVRGTDTEVSLRFADDASEHSEEPRLGLWTVMAQVLTRSMLVVGPDEYEHLEHPPRYWHFSQPGYLDVTIEPNEWWQISFIDYFAEWRDESLRMGTIQRKGLQRWASPRLEGEVRALPELMSRLIGICRERLPEHAPRFDFILATLQQRRD